MVNILMRALIENNDSKQALRIYDEYEEKMNDISHLYAIKACTHSGNWDRGKLIHCKLTRETSFDNVILKNALIEFYGQQSETEEALKIFDSIEENEKNSNSINAIIKALGSTECALQVYTKYTHLIDDVSHISALKVCRNANDKSFGESIHRSLKDKKIDIQLQNAFIGFFGHFGDVKAAMNAFESVQEKDAATINSIIGVLSDCECFDDAMTIYDQFEHLHDDISHLLAIKFCAKSNNFHKGRYIHSQLSDFDERSIALKNTLIDFYGHFERISTSKRIFYAILNDGTADVFSFGAMMNALCNNGMDAECIKLFQFLQRTNEIQMNVVCYSNLFKACTLGTNYHFGHQIHEKLKNDTQNKWMLNESEIEVTLMNMYGKCGMLRVCDEIFAQSKRNAIGIWNAFIYAHGRNGNATKAKKIFDQMRRDTDLCGDHRTFIVLMNACAHSGDAEQAKEIWDNEISDDSIKYHKNVITSLIDCYSRKGRNELIEAHLVIQRYFEQNGNKYNDEDVTMLMALLSGCKKFNHHELAKQIYAEMNAHFSNNAKYLASAATILSSIFKR